MKHIRSFNENIDSRSSIVTVGVFDGVHRGHQVLVKHIVERARSENLNSIIITFFPYPELVIHGHEPGFYLTLPDEKASLLADMGINVLVTLPFTNSLRMKRADEFLSEIETYLSMYELWVGPDFALGYKREGNLEFLHKRANEHKFELHVIDSLGLGAGVISSSRIRQALANGAVDQATLMLGRLYQIKGKVIRGDGRGRTIGIPTANLSVPTDKALPQRGVYTAWATCKNQRIAAVVNIGIRPTVSGDQSMHVEAHLLDFEGDLYGQMLGLEFVSRLRDEQKFGSIDELVSQINADINVARNLLANDNASTG